MISYLMRMAAISCPHCAELQDRVAELEEIVRRQQAALQELTAKLGQNSSKSWIPPSANPLHAPKPVAKKKSKRKPGAPPGHPPRLKRPLPAERVFVERILTVVQTRRLQGTNVLEYLHDAVPAHRAGQPCPKLLPDR